MGIFKKSNETHATIVVGAETTTAEKAFKKLKKMVGGIITAVLIKKAVKYTWQIAQMGATAIQVADNFENFAKQRGKQDKKMMASLRNATMGMVTDMELQQKAMQAMVGGVKFDDIVTSMQYVTKFASATGTSVSQKMQTTMTGLARGSAMFLDDIGIQVMGSKDIVNDAVAQMKEKMEEFTMSEQDAAVKSTQLIANLKMMATGIGKELQPAYNGLLDILNKVTKKISDIRGYNISFTATEKLENKINDTARALQFLSDSQKKHMAAFKVSLKDGSTYYTKYIKRIMSKPAGETWTKKVIQQKKEIIKFGKRSVLDKIALEKQLQVYLRQKNQLESKELDIINKVAAAERKKEAAKIVKPTVTKAKIETSIINFGTDRALKLRSESQRKAQEGDLENYKLYIKQIEDADKNLANVKTENLQNEYDRRKAVIELQYTEEQEMAVGNNLALKSIKAAYDVEMLQVDQDKAAAKKQSSIDMVQSIGNGIVGVGNKIGSILTQITEKSANKDIAALDRKAMGEEKYLKEKEKIEKKAAAKRKKIAILELGMAVIQATQNALMIGLTAAKDTPGGAITKGIALAVATTMGMAQVASIAALKFQDGGLVGSQLSQSKTLDKYPAMLGEGEFVVNAASTAKHKDKLEDINNDTPTSNIAGNTTIIQNYYGMPTQEVADANIQIVRNNTEGFSL